MIRRIFLLSWLLNHSNVSDKYNTGPVISAPLSRLRPDRHAKRQSGLSGMREKIILGPGTCM